MTSDVERDEAFVPEPPVSISDRRTLLRTAVGSAAALLATGRAAATPPECPGPNPPTPTWPATPEQRLVDRITCGYSLQARAHADQLGYADYLDEQLNPVLADDPEVIDRLAGLLSLGMTGEELANTYGTTMAPAMRELKEATIIRQVYSKWQLYERMVEFWTDHFNIAHNKGHEGLLKTLDDRDVIRQHALGSFHDLLRESAQENYARELLELHTLGLENDPPAYDEDDVALVARCLTGWSLHWPGVQPPSDPPSYGKFRYVHADHDTDPKGAFLGILADSWAHDQTDGERVLDELLAHRSTAEFISRKMIRWLLTETPCDGLVARVADVYDATSGDIKAMIRAILQPEDPGKAFEDWTPKFRRPQHLTVSLLRALEIDVSYWEEIMRRLEALGQRPFDWPSPDGYPDNAQAWGYTPLPRWNVAADLADNTLGGAGLPFNKLHALLLATGQGDAVDAIDHLLTGGRLDDQDLSVVQAYLGVTTYTQAAIREAVGLIASAPSYQQY